MDVRGKKTSVQSMRSVSFDNRGPTTEEVPTYMPGDDDIFTSHDDLETLIESYHTSTENTRKPSVLASFVSSVIASVRKLKKSVGFPQGFALMVGIIIGSGIFIAPSLVASDVKDVYTSIVIWGVSGMIALCGALCYCELGTTIKMAGGNYAYVLFIYGNVPAFLCSWTQALLIDPTTVSVISLTLGNYVLKPFHELIEPNPWYPKIIACCCILLICTTNCLSIKASTSLQSLFNVCQVLSIVFLASLGIWKLSTGHTDNLQHVFNNASIDWNNLGAYGSALFGALWAYNGWQNVGNVSEEMVNVEKTLFRTVVTALPFVTVSYLVVNVSFFAVLTIEEVSASSSVAVEFAQKIFGEKTAYIVPILVALSCYGSANGNTFACTRISLAAGREGHMPEILGMIHRKRRTPIPAIILTACIAILMLIPDGSTLQVLINFSSISTWLIFLIVFPGVIYLRWKEPSLQRPFKVWLIVPVVMTFVSLLLVVLPFLSRPLSSTIAIIFILLGLPVYFVCVHWEKRHPNWFVRCNNKLTFFLKTRLDLVPCST